MSITHVYACDCGQDTRCEPQELMLGRVFQCPACKEVRAHVYPRGGGRAWIEVMPSDVRFHNLLGETNDQS